MYIFFFNDVSKDVITLFFNRNYADSVARGGGGGGC